MTTPEESFPAVWRRALESLDAAGVTPQQRAFVRLARPVGLLDGTALLAAPNDLTKEILEQRVRDTITQLLSEQLGYVVRLAVTVDSSLTDDPSGPIPLPPPPRLVERDFDSPGNGSSGGSGRHRELDDDSDFHTFSPEGVRITQGRIDNSIDSHHGGGNTDEVIDIRNFERTNPVPGGYAPSSPFYVGPDRDRDRYVGDRNDRNDRSDRNDRRERQDREDRDLDRGPSDRLDRNDRGDSGQRQFDFGSSDGSRPESSRSDNSRSDGSRNDGSQNSQLPR